MENFETDVFHDRQEKEKFERYALVSVYDKTGIAPLASVLDSMGYRIISTGGTARVLSESNIPVTPVEEITGNPEAFDGRMKTISFQVEGGILFNRSNLQHIQQAKELNLPQIDIVVCNLYPLEQTVANPTATLREAIENIDVGGPTMIRAAAKNFEHVLVLTDPGDYDTIAQMLAHGSVTVDVRKKLAAKAFRLLSFYDSRIGEYLDSELFPDKLTLAATRNQVLRYGDNPHQKAALYLDNTDSAIGRLERLSGREISATNLTDINAGIEVVRLFPQTHAATIIKHNTPCGIGLGYTSREALSRAIEADPVSAFGGVVVLNDVVDRQTAEVIASFKDERRSNIDIIAAAGIEDDALAMLTFVRKTMGIYTFGYIPEDSRKVSTRIVDGGFILQTRDIVEEGFADWKVVTNAKLTDKQLHQIKIGWKFISRIKSNSVIVVDPEFPITRGIGAGQTSRIDAARIALGHAKRRAKGAILVSDGYFPFPDCVELAIQGGIGAIAQPGGSVNDTLSIDAANRGNIPMVFTQRRAFWH